uniref:Uncharacterized protein n=1 Tax=Peronospora matthiolae TaxID=2874970 RepID=A0AAV1VPF2_9STRA
MSTIARWMIEEGDDDDDGDSEWGPDYENDSISVEDEANEDGTPILSAEQRAQLDKVFKGEVYTAKAFRRSTFEAKQREGLEFERIAHQLRGYIEDKQTSQTSLKRRQLMFRTLCDREVVGMSSNVQLVKLQETFMPFQEHKHCRVVDSVRDRLYCGGFNSTGSRFLTAGQRGAIMLYDTIDWTRAASLPVRDVRWTVTDAKFTPDDKSVLYSTINSNVRMVSNKFDEDGKEDVYPLVRSVRGRDESQLMRMNRSGRFGVWCIDINASGTEFVAGTSQSSVVLMDMETRVPMCHVVGHHDDVNAIAFVDGPLHTNVFVSGSDDMLIKLWDRRVLSESYPKPQSVFTGHTDGITHISSRDDGYYFISNSKDQTTKLWDIRKCSSSNQLDEAAAFRKPFSWDYRFQAYPGRNMMPIEHPNDKSVMTYRGHMVVETLIRCYFSPLHSTAQKYVYTGSADGRVYAYDSISGDLVEIFAMKPNGLTRDVRWHPFEPTIVSPDFYGKLCVWQRQDDEEDKCLPVAEH